MVVVDFIDFPGLKGIRHTLCSTAGGVVRAGAGRGGGDGGTVSADLFSAQSQPQ